MLLGTELTSPLELAFALLIIAVAALVFGTVSFGMGVVGTPPLLLLIDPKTAIVVINTHTVLVSLLVLIATRRHLDLRKSRGLIVGGLVGTPLGVLLLNVSEPAALRIVIGGVIVVLGLLNLREINFPFASFPGSGLFFGFITCLAVTAISIGGVIAAIYAIAQKWPAQTVRASLAALFVLSGVTQVILYAVSGLYTASTATTVGLTFPAILVGFGLASLLATRINERAFRYVVVVLVIFGGSVLLARELI
jgi:uncharacterized membrane protein YfcA